MLEAALAPDCLIHSVFIRICVCNRGKLRAPSQRWSLGAGGGARTSGMFWLSSQKREDQAAFGPGAETIQTLFLSSLNLISEQNSASPQKELIFAIQIFSTKFSYILKWIVLKPWHYFPSLSVSNFPPFCVYLRFEFSFYGHISIIFFYHPPFQKVNRCVQDVKRSGPEMRFIDLKRIWNG